MLSFTSCEREEDYGKAIYSGDEPISYLYWSEASDEIFFCIERSAFSRSLYAVNINSKDSRKIADITTNAGNSIFQKDDKIYYFNDMDYANVKLYSVNVSGSTPELIVDSLQSPVFSKKYVAFLKLFNLPDTSFIKTFLYDIDNKAETPIESDKNSMPVSISPDGSILLLRSWDLFYNTVFLLYDTRTSQTTNLPLSYVYDFYRFFWVDEEIYAFRGTQTGSEIVKLRSNTRVNFAEALTYDHSYELSPSGKMLVYVTEVPPEMAAGLVGNHYYLNILKAGSSEKITIDLERDYVFGGYLTFSPDDSRIAYVRDFNEIFILNL
jgi:hypothetical protein